MSPQRSPNISGSDDGLNAMVPLDSDKLAQANKTAMDNAQNWQSKIYDDPPPTARLKVRLGEIT